MCHTDCTHTQREKMARRYVCALVISAGVICVTGLLTSWMMGFEKTENTIKSLTNQFTISTNTAQTETTPSVDASVGSEGVLNTAKAEMIPNFPGTESMRFISVTSVVSRASSAVDIDEASRQTTAETTALSTVRSGQTTAAGAIASSDDTQKLKTAILPVTDKDERLETVERIPDETVITCTGTVENSNLETLTKTVPPERITQTHKSETDMTTFEKTKEASITVSKQESGKTLISEPVTNRVTHFRITSEIKATTKNRPENTFSTAAILTKTKVDSTEGNSAPSTVIKKLKTTEIEPSKVESSETTTVRPQESTQATKTSNAPTMLNGATGMNRLTTVQTATETQEITGGKQFSSTGEGITIKLFTIQSTLNHLNNVSLKRQTVTVFDKLTTRTHKSLSSCKGKCSTKWASKNTVGQRGKKKPLDKTLYSAIIMGCILVTCVILALVVFVKDFIRH